MPVLKYWNGSAWIEVPATTALPGPIGPTNDQVTTVNGQSGNVVLTKSDIAGLSNVDNTADTAKPVSTAMQTELDKKVTRPTVTRVMSYSNGGMFSTIPELTPANLGPAGGWRQPMRIAAYTTRWRLRVRNFNGRDNSAENPLTGKKIIFGDELLNPTAVPALGTGNFTGSPGSATTIIDADFAIPGNGEWYVTPWIEDSNLQFGADKSRLLALSFTSVGGSASMGHTLMGAGFVYWWQDATSAVDATRLTGTVTAAIGTYIPLDWVIDYEVTSDQKAFLFIGDSITEGISGGKGLGSAPNGVWRSAPQIWGRRNNVLVANMSLAGALTQNFHNPNFSIWKRFDHDNAKYDGAVIALGSNDCANVSAGTGASLAVMQSNILEIIAKAKSLMGPDKPVYVSNITCRSDGTMTATEDDQRLAYNQWLSQLPSGLIAGVIDAEGATRGDFGVSPKALNPAHSTDLVHMSYAGLVALSYAYDEAIQL